MQRQAPPRQKCLDALVGANFRFSTPRQTAPAAVRMHADAFYDSVNDAARENAFSRIWSESISPRLHRGGCSRVAMSPIRLERAPFMHD